MSMILNSCSIVIRDIKNCEDVVDYEGVGDNDVESMSRKRGMQDNDVESTF